MKKGMSLLVALVLVFSLSLGCFAETTTQVVNVGEDELNVEVSAPEESSGVTIVLESGYADDMSSFDDLYKALEGKARLIRYDRAGLGKSSDTNKRKTVDKQVESLELLLEELKVEGKVIYVAHSLGGYNARLFASRNDVAGVVLLDASHEDQHKAIYELEMPDLWAMYVGQFVVEGSYSDVLYSADLIRNKRDALRDVPLVVISGNQHGIPEFETIWEGFQEDLLSLSDKGERHILDCGHYVHKDQTEFVKNQILELIEEVK